MQITININNATDEPSVHVEQHFDAPKAQPIPRIAAVFPEPMDDDARRALFAAWRDAFPNVDHRDERTMRLSFTRTVLGLSNSDDASWSRDGSLTSDQAYYMVRVLNTISEIV